MKFLLSRGTNDGTDKEDNPLPSSAAYWEDRLSAWVVEFPTLRDLYNALYYDPEFSVVLTFFNPEDNLDAVKLNISGEVVVVDCHLGML